MSNKLPQSVMNLKQFVVRQNVLSLYRKILRVIKSVPGTSDRDYLRNWARSEFQANKNLTDEFAIKSALIHGENSMKELQKTLRFSK